MSLHGKSTWLLDVDMWVVRLRIIVKVILSSRKYGRMVRTETIDDSIQKRLCVTKKRLYAVMGIWQGIPWYHPKDLALST
jgi:hypothetical protein